MSRRGFAGAVLMGAALALPMGTAVAETLPTESGCPQDPRICQSDTPGEQSPTAESEDDNTVVYTVVGVGAGVALVAGGVIASRRRGSSVDT